MTRQTYYQVWKQFANFYQWLDYQLTEWEQRITLFIGYLVEQKKQSSMVRSYLSPIRAVLKIDGVKLKEDLFLVNALTRACKFRNDQIRTRLPISKSLLHRLLEAVDTHFLSGRNNQPYLSILYRTLFSTAYYGLFRVGELTTGGHPVLAKNVQIGTNKSKMQFILYTSKMHGQNNVLQKVKISNTRNNAAHHAEVTKYCPFELLRHYALMRGPFRNQDEPFFMLSDGKPVKLAQMNHCLKDCLVQLGKNPRHYSVHSFPIGRSNDLLKLGLSVESIKRLGRWKSNAVFKYFRKFTDM